MSGETNFRCTSSSHAGASKSAASRYSWNSSCERRQTDEGLSFEAWALSCGLLLQLCLKPLIELFDAQIPPYDILWV